MDCSPEKHGPNGGDYRTSSLDPSAHVWNELPALNRQAAPSQLDYGVILYGVFGAPAAKKRDGGASDGKPLHLAECGHAGAFGGMEDVSSAPGGLVGVVVFDESELGDSVIDYPFGTLGANVAPRMGKRRDAAAMHGVQDLDVDLFGFLRHEDRAAASGLMFA